MNVGVIVATQRSGTNALRSILRKCGGVVDLKEILGGGMADGMLNTLTRTIKEAETFTFGGKEMTNVFDAYFQRLEGYEADGVRLVIFDCKYNAFSPLNPSGWSPCHAPYFLTYCLRRKFKLLHLVRENILETYLSALRVRATGEWHWPKDATKPRVGEAHVVVNLDVLKEEMARRRAEIALFRGYLASSAMEVTFETLLQPATLAAVGAYFQIEITDFEPEYEKIVKNPREMVANYAEMEAFIRQDPELNGEIGRFICRGV